MSKLSRSSGHHGYNTLEHNPDAPGQLVEQLPLGSGNAEVNRHPKGRFTEDLPLGAGNAEVVHRSPDSTNLPEPIPQSSYTNRVAYAGEHPQPYGYQTDGYGNGGYSNGQYMDSESGLRAADEKAAAGKKPDICGIPRRTFWIILGVIVGLIVIAGALGGALGATLGDNSHKSSSGSKGGSATATSTSVGPYPTAAGNGYTGLRANSSLATLAFDGGTDGPQYAVYYQDENEFIKQSFYNTSTRTWTVTTLNYNKLPAKPGSALAAAVTGANRTWHTEVLYFDNEDHLHELWNWQGGAGVWTTGYVDQHNYTAAPNSKLAAIEDNCALCSQGLLWFWQDTNSSIRLGNTTTVPGVGMVDAVIANNATPGSGLAVSPFGAAGEPQNYQLFYQNNNNELTRLGWHPGNVTNFTNSTGQGWNDTQVLGPVNGQGEIASYTYGRTYPSYHPQSMLVFNSLKKGVNVTLWLGSGDNGAGAWTGSSQPQTMSGVTGYDPIAATNARQVFAISNGKIQHFNAGDDNESWTLVGTVPTK